MASIFRKDDNYVDKPNRNTFDLSFQNNLTTKFGKLVPCFCQEVIPGDSFKIEPTFGLRFLPQVFPVQTRMRATVHFFYVRNRPLWKEWMDFIGKTKEDLVLPYLDFSNGKYKLIKESSIFDYMGLPTTVQSKGIAKSDIGEVVRRRIDDFTFPLINSDNGQFSLCKHSTQSYIVKGFDGDSVVCLYHEYGRPIDVDPEKQNIIPVDALTLGGSGNGDTFLVVDVQSNGSNDVLKACIKVLPRANTEYVVQVTQTFDGQQYNIVKVYGYYTEGPSSNIVPSLVPELETAIYLESNLNYPVSLLSERTNPYHDLKINALPFRAYEAVYNSFYRNAENNPFLIDGVPEYNKYVKTDAGGAQSADDFALFNKNWEDDAFTTAVPTPQQGNAPLVGLSSVPDSPVILRYSREDGNVGALYLKADSTGYVTAVDADAVGVAPSLNDNIVAALDSAINFGITINDLRNVNALQLWLEKNVRKGYKYRDQLLSHYGVSVSYNDLLMPEFIGGVSRDVTVNQISQTVETSTGNLGDMAGQAYVIGEGKSISHFCDEHGFIIGILSVTPVPNYSQLIPKYLFKHDVFDFYFPEFGKIGMQPITNKEVAAMASVMEGKADMVFGYQRAWYDYLANVDRVHGKFNGQFYDFLIQRKFASTPELGADFTTIKSEDLNNIFYVDNDEDKILGQIYFDVKAIRPIPLYGIPSIE